MGEVVCSFESGKCDRCGKKLFSTDNGFCKACVEIMFGRNAKPVIFCKKCKSFEILPDDVIESALKSVGMKSFPEGHIILLADSCLNCHKGGDPKKMRFFQLKAVYS